MKIVITKILVILSFLLLIGGCEKIFIKPSDTNYCVDDFEMTWNAINSVYPLLEYKQLDWDSIHTKYHERAENSHGDESYLLIFDLLRELKDPHVYMVNPGGGTVIPYPGIRFMRDKDLYDPLITRKYFNNELLFACQDKVEYGILDGNIGYVYISNFNDENAMNDFYIVMNYVRNTSSLIIDVRRNTGGWTENVAKVINKFIDTIMPYPKGFTIYT